MKLSDLEAAGAYLSTGFVDIYHEGRHKRLAAMVGGELSLTAEGEAFVAALAVAAPVEPETPAPPARRAARAKKADAAPEAPAVDDDMANALGDALGDLDA